MLCPDARLEESHVQEVREHFRHQGEASRQLGSPFTAMLAEMAAERLDATTEVGGAILAWPGNPLADALALRFIGSLHALVLSDASPELARAYAEPGEPEDLWPVIAAALDRHATAILRFLDSPPQTNEVARSAVLLGGFATIAARTRLPLALLEIGASAGLNLHWDAYGYRLGDASWGPAAAPLRLEPEWRGPMPPLGPIEVHSRRGCDQRPINPGDPQDRLRLRAYVWADQPARLARLEAALDHAARQGARVERADAADWVEARLAERPAGLVTVLYHSIVWQYLPKDVQHRIVAALERAGDAADAGSPLAWLRMEPARGKGHAELLLTSWPGGYEQRLADADYHGRWVSWRPD